MIKDLKHRMIRVGLIGVLSFSVISSGFSAPTANMDQLPQFVLNLGGYLGYDLNNYNGPTPPSSIIQDSKSLADTQKMAVELYLGTMIDKSIIDSNSPLASLNQFINAIFKSGVSSTPSTGQQSSPSAWISKLIDQTPYQNNPINQSILNTLTTPDFSFCKLITPCMNAPDSSGGTDLASRCCGTYGHSQYQVELNVISYPPQTLEVFNALDSSTLNQLNGNALIEPLLYSTSTNTNNSNASIGLNTQTNVGGLQATTQAQEAENFIRYVTGEVTPLPKTTATTYETLFSQTAYLRDPKATAAQFDQGLTAQSTLVNYLSGLRVFAAQASVGVSNLYYILSKRMGQKTGSTGSNSSTSQALNEYTMATRRLYDPTSKNPQWVDQINTASSATVQKEIAVLLSEINYQLYLTRQQQERLLLTNTVMLFQLGHLVEPPPLQAPQ